MANLLKTTFSILDIKLLYFCFKFHWIFFCKDQITIIQHWFKQWLGAKQASYYITWTSITGINPRLFNRGRTPMTTRSATACSQVLPVKPQGVWARGEHGHMTSETGVSEVGVFRALQPNGVDQLPWCHTMSLVLNELKQWQNQKMATLAIKTNLPAWCHTHSER